MTTKKSDILPSRQIILLLIPLQLFQKFFEHQPPVQLLQPALVMLLAASAFVTSVRRHDSGYSGDSRKSHVNLLYHRYSNWYF